MSGYLTLVEDRRAVLVMSGNQARDVLQDVVTNDVSAASAERAVYAAMLTPQGKFLSDFFVLSRGDDLILDVEAARAEALMTRLRMYCLRRDAAVASDGGIAVTLVWPTSDPAVPPDIPEDMQIVPDPRDARLGWRVYGGSTLSLEPGSRAEYDGRRIAQRVPEAGPDLRAEETYILEAGFERLNGVDFKKGCYVGQEVTARMKHKTELRKGMVGVDVEGTADPGTEIVANGKVVGMLLSNVGGRGLAHLRFDRAAPEMTAGDAIVRYTA